MKTHPECYHCISRQAVSVVTRIESNPGKQIRIIRKILALLEQADDWLTPSEIAGETNRVLRDELCVEDLYLDVKAAGHELAMGYLEDLRILAREGEDPLEQWLKIAAAGNIIDIVHARDYNLWDEVQTTVNQELFTTDLDAFKAALEKASHLLYLADNVGETVFDRVLIENLDLPVIYAVKSGPILNDATREYAEKAGIDQLAEIVETGSCAPGTVLSQTSEEFQQMFTNAPLVLSKGQANYETVDELGDKVFFLLRMKCPVIYERLDAPEGRLVLKRGNPLG